MEDEKRKENRDDGYGTTYHQTQQIGHKHQQIVPLLAAPSAPVNGRRAEESGRTNC